MVRRRELGPLRWEPRPHLLPRVEVRRRELPERQRRRLTNGVATAPGPDQCENAQTQGTFEVQGNVWQQGVWEESIATLCRAAG
jgi:hypothetical protein